MSTYQESIDKFNDFLKKFIDKKSFLDDADGIFNKKNIDNAVNVFFYQAIGNKNDKIQILKDRAISLQQELKKDPKEDLDFYEKLEKQLNMVEGNNRDDSLRNFIANVLWLRYLPISEAGTSMKTKFNNINKVYKLANTNSEDIFTKGLASYGSAQTDIYSEIAFLVIILDILIKKIESFKSNTDNKIEELKKTIVSIINNPENFINNIITLKKDEKSNNKDENKFVEKINFDIRKYFEKSKLCIKNMLLFLCSPSDYECIAVDSDKERLVNRFSYLIKDNNISRDIKIKIIKIELSKILKINIDNFYSSDVLPLWKQNIDLELFKIKKQIIYYGSPGTGKTYKAEELCKNLFSSFLVNNVLNNKYEYKFEDYFNSIQFHSSFTYEDFIEGIKPMKDKDENKIYPILSNGVFKNICRNAAKWEIEYLQLKNNNGHFNDIKTFSNLKISDIISIKDNLDDKSELKKLLVDGLNENNVSDIIPPYFIFIDELNRAELSRVFGELMYCLEYRGSDNKIKTQYSYLVKNENDASSFYFDGNCNWFFVPDNIYLVGTMNTIDRSVETIDFAMRRRFVWIEVPPFSDNSKERKEFENLLKKFINESCINDDMKKELLDTYLESDRTEIEKDYFLNEIKNQILNNLTNENISPEDINDDDIKNKFEDINFDDKTIKKIKINSFRDGDKFRKYTFLFKGKNIEIDIKSIFEKTLISSFFKLNNEIKKEQRLGKDYQIGHTYLFDFVKYFKMIKVLEIKEKNLYNVIWNYNLEPLLREYLRGRNLESKLEDFKSIFCK